MVRRVTRGGIPSRRPAGGVVFFLCATTLKNVPIAPAIDSHGASATLSPAWMNSSKVRKSTIATASLKSDSPAIIDSRFGSTPTAPKTESVATGSVAEMSDANANASLSGSTMPTMPAWPEP